MQGFWDTVASREFLAYLKQIAKSLKVIADYCSELQETKKDL